MVVWMRLWVISRHCMNKRSGEGRGTSSTSRANRGRKIDSSPIALSDHPRQLELEKSQHNR
eukprot:scaffold130972_cov36-Tisochrysis_lutea.AAC.1